MDTIFNYYYRGSFSIQCLRCSESVGGGEWCGGGEADAADQVWERLTHEASRGFPLVDNNNNNTFLLSKYNHTNKINTQKHSLFTPNKQLRITGFVSVCHLKSSFKIHQYKKVRIDLKQYIYLISLFSILLNRLGK